MLLRQFARELWTAEGPVVSFYGFRYPTRMAVIRLRDGSLFVWSPIPLTTDLRAEVDALGRVANLVSPNLLHHMWLGEWKGAYPEARLYASPGLAKRRRDLAFDAIVAETTAETWGGEIEPVVVGGNLFMTEVVFLHGASRTAIFSDLIENFPPDWFTGWRGVVARADGIVNPDYGAPREFRFGFWRRDEARRALQHIIAFAPEKVVIAHGMMAESNGTDFIRQAFRWLLD